MCQSVRSAAHLSSSWTVLLRLFRHTLGTLDTIKTPSLITGSPPPPPPTHSVWSLDGSHGVQVNGRELHALVLELAVQLLHSQQLGLPLEGVHPVLDEAQHSLTYDRRRIVLGEGERELNAVRTCYIHDFVHFTTCRGS